MQKILSAGAVPVRKRKGHWEFLLLRAFHYWDFPKGVVEDGEDPWTAAMREVEEETGLTDLSTPWGREFYETKPYGKGKIARYYLVRSDEDKDVVLLPNPVTGILEHHEYRWVSDKEANDLVGPRIKAVLDWAKGQITSPYNKHKAY